MLTVGTQRTKDSPAKANELRENQVVPPMETIVMSAEALSG